MKISNLLYWFWPFLSFVLAGLWLGALLRQRRMTISTLPVGPGLALRPVEVEDALKAAYATQEAGGAWSSEELTRSMGLSRTMAEGLRCTLVASGWAEEDAPGGMVLTKAGETRAQELIRAHRLWERYLVDREGMPMEAVHSDAHRREHLTTPEELERLDAELGYPAWDPHGHAIPASGCRVPSPQASTLFEEGKPGNRLRIVSLDDEPAELLAQLAVMELKPGVNVEVLEKKPGFLRLLVDGNMVLLAAAAARHISAMPAPFLPVPLGELRVGSRARVVEIRGTGKHQRRMLDMGLVPGAEIIVVREAPLKDPVEYRVKGTDISMRRADANTVLVEEVAYG